MKAFFTLCFVFLGTFLFAQGDITQKVSDALKKGDASALSSNFMDQVEMTILGKEGTYSRSDAKTHLSTFFTQNTPKDFSVKHQGTSKLDDQYRIGDLSTTRGVYRVTFFMKKTGNAMQVKELKIEAGGE